MSARIRTSATASALRGASSVLAFVPLACGALGLALAIYFQSPAAVRNNDADGAFSNARAMAHVRELAREPHPVGSLAHDRVRDYIRMQLLALGLTPEIQHSVTVVQDRSEIRVVGTDNVITRISSGKARAGAVLLSAHYDTVPTSPGASDNSGSVASLLEVARTLRNDRSLQRDIILLFDDAEEIGLVGASAFVREHAWARDVEVVLNFDARGSSGPVLMFETSAHSGAAIRAFSLGSYRYCASSLFPDVYHHMPNGTSFTALRHPGLPGLNFANIGGIQIYHSALDRPDTLDPTTLQQRGDYAVALTRRLATAVNPITAQDELIYFDILGMCLITYPQRWALPITLVLTVVVGAMAAVAIRRQHTRVQGQLVAIVALVGAAVFLYRTTAFVAWLVAVRYPTLAESTNLCLAYLGIGTLVVSAFCLTYALRRLSTLDIWIGAIVIWLVLSVVLSLHLAGASYLAAVPLIASLPALALESLPRPSQLWRLVALSASALSIGVIVLPMLYLIGVGLQLPGMGVVAVLGLLALILLTPHMRLLTSRQHLAAASIAGIMMLPFVARARSRHQECALQNAISYVLDLDNEQAFWASPDGSVDEWTTQFLGPQPQQGDLSFLPFPHGKLLYNSAPVLPSVLGLSIQEGHRVPGRTLHFRVETSPRTSECLLAWDTGSELVHLTVNNLDIPIHRGPQTGTAPLLIRFMPVVAGGLDVLAQSAEPGTQRLKVVSITLGLPQVAGYHSSTRPRIPGRHPMSEKTFVVQSFVL